MAVIGAVSAGSPRSWSWVLGPGVQVRAASLRCPPTTRSAQGHRRESRRIRRRPVVMTRPATARSRSRIRLGSQTRAGWSCQARSWVQVRSSAASWASSSQIWFLSNAWSGRLVAPVSFRARIRSSARARSRWVTSRSASRPAAGVGGEHGDPPALVVGDPQLGAGVGTLAAGDHPHPGWPALERGRQPPGQLGDLGALTRAPVGIQCLLPGLLGEHLERVEDGLAAVDADRVLQAQVVDVPDERLDPRAGVATHQHPGPERARAAGPGRRRGPRSGPRRRWRSPSRAAAARPAAHRTRRRRGRRRRASGGTRTRA